MNTRTRKSANTCKHQRCREGRCDRIRPCRLQRVKMSDRERSVHKHTPLTQVSPVGQESSKPPGEGQGNKQREMRTLAGSAVANEPVGASSPNAAYIADQQRKNEERTIVGVHLHEPLWHVPVAPQAGLSPPKWMRGSE